MDLIKPTQTIWDETLKKGNFGEELILRWFGGKNGYNDLLINAEIKNSWKGWEIFIEEMSVIEQNKKGWIYTTKSDCVIFVNKKRKRAVVIETKELQIGYANIKDKYKLMVQETRRGNQVWHSNGRWIPLDEFSGTVLIPKPSKYSLDKDGQL